MNKISVITVVYNDVDNIRQTMESFFSQTWEDKEYIVIDGGSTDGTADIIKEYADKLAYWCSEKDEGIYDAMNKGIKQATGEWINILNSGDCYCSEKSLEEIFSNEIEDDVDVVYGNSIAASTIQDDHIEAGNDITMLEYFAIYRHGCSLTRRTTHMKFLYNTTKKSQYGFALDYDAIYRMYHDGCTFRKVAVEIQRYEIDGTSNNKYKSLLYNFRITTQYGRSFKKFVFFIKSAATYAVKNNPFFYWLRCLVFEFILNDLVTIIPSWTVRKSLMSAMGIKIGKGSFISKKAYFMASRKFSLGDNSNINRECFLDARGGLKIGNNVSISHRVNLVTGGHYVNAKDFRGRYLPIVINDYAWLGIGCTILQGVTIGRGAVVCAGAVVTKDVQPYAIVAGIPAVKINERSKDLSYKCILNTPFT